MTYLRMTGGRDRGEVKEFNFADGQELMARGAAIAVDLNDPNWIDKRLDLVELAPLEASAAEELVLAQTIGPLAGDVSAPPAAGTPLLSRLSRLKQSRRPGSR